MAIALVTSGTGSGGASDGGDITLTLPTLLQNDAVYIVVTNSGSGFPTMSTSGYTQAASAGSSAQLRVFRKLMGATPDTQAVITGNGVTGASTTAVFICLRGVDTTTPEDASATSANAFGTNPDAPSITTVTDNAWVIACAGMSLQDATITAPSGYSNGTTNSRSGTTNGSTVALATNLVATHGAENPASWTNWSSGNWTAISVAVRPSTGTPLTGVAGTGAVGTVAPTSATPLTGAAGTSVAGSVTPTTSVALTGVKGTTALGTLSPIGGNTFVAVTGVSSTASPGAVAPVTSIPLTGIASTGGVGTLSPNISKAITGSAATSSLGSVVPTTSIRLTGVQATTALGSIVGMTDFVPSRMLMLFG